MRRCLTQHVEISNCASRFHSPNLVNREWLGLPQFFQVHSCLDALVHDEALELAWLLEFLPVN